MEENKEFVEENFWLLHFPIMFFASVMGVGGLSLVVNKSIDIFELQESFGWLSILCVIVSVILFIVIVILYGLKWLNIQKLF